MQLVFDWKLDRYWLEVVYLYREYVGIWQVIPRNFLLYKHVLLSAEFLWNSQLLLGRSGDLLPEKHRTSKSVAVLGVQGAERLLLLSKFPVGFA